MARLILLALLLLPGVALADPVTLVFTALQAVGVSTAISIGVSLGVGLLGAASARRKQRAAAAKQRAAYLASLQDRNVTVLSTEAPWKIVYGSPAPIGGAIQAILTSGSVDQYQHLVIVFNARPSQSIDEIYIEGEPVGALDGAGWCTGGKFYEAGANTITETVAFNGAGVGTVSHPVGTLLSIATAVAGDPGEHFTSYSGSASGTTVTCADLVSISAQVSYTYATGTARVNVQKHLSPAGVDTADAFLIAACPAKWTSAHKASGLTYIVLTLDVRFGGFQGGPPNVTAKGQWSLLYDYRTSTTAYSANPALCAADFLTAEYGFAAGVSQIDTAAAIAAANDCDAQGFTCHGVVETDNGRDANLQQIEDSMAGATHFSGGVWRIMCGAWSTPVMTLTDGIMAAPIEVVQASNTSGERYNTVRGQYSPAEGLGTVPDYTPYVVAAYVTADGKEKALDLPLPMVGTNAQAQKLAAIAVERSRLGETINYPAHLAAWKLQPGDRVYVTNAGLGYAAKTFRMVDWTFSASAPVGLVLTEDTAAVYTGTWTNPDADDPTSDLPDPFERPTAPEMFDGQSGTNQLQVASDGSIIARVLWTWAASTQRTVVQGGHTQLQWRDATSTDDRWQGVDLASDTTQQHIDGQADGAVLLGRVRFVNQFGVQGAWSTKAHTVVGKTEPPTSPTFVIATRAQVSWGVVPDADVVRGGGYVVRAYPGSTGAVFSRATVLHAGLLTSTPWALPASLYGAQTIMVVAQDSSGNQSAPVSAVVSFGATATGNALQSLDMQAMAYPGTQADCSVSGGNLVAASSNDLYALADVFGEPDVYATAYGAMVWTAQPFVPAYQGGMVTLLSSFAGAAITVEYQIDGSTQLDAYASSDVYASADLYGASSSFAPWPGALPANRMEGIVFRVSIGGGSEQGTVGVFTPQLIMPDVRQTFGNLTVAAAGQRLDPATGTPARNWIQINTAQVTPVVDGGGAISGRVLDLSAGFGPLVQLVDITGAAVAGRASIDIGGIADE